MRLAYFNWIPPHLGRIDLSAGPAEIFRASGRNMGNLVHLNAYEKILRGHEFTRVDVHEVEKINTHDLLLVGCANQLGKHLQISDGAIECLEKIKIPIIACSLGAQAETNESVDFLSPDASSIKFFRIINSKRGGSGPNISVRGGFSQRVLKHHGIDSVVTGCITTLQFKPQIGEILRNKFLGKEIRNVCVAGTNPLHKWASQIEKQLMEIVESYHGVHIVQSPQDMISLAMGNGGEIPDWFEQVYQMPKQEIRRWFVRFGRIFTNTELWGNVLGMYDLAIGARYHGVALAIASETLGTVFSIDSRTSELCETSGIKKLEIKELLNKTPGEIIDMCTWTQEDYDKLSKQSEIFKNEYRIFIKDNGLEI